MDTTPKSTVLTENQNEELNRRIKYGEENPKEMIPWKDVYIELLKKYDDNINLV